MPLQLVAKVFNADVQEFKDLKTGEIKKTPFVELLDVIPGKKSEKYTLNIDQSTLVQWQQAGGKTVICAVRHYAMHGRGKDGKPDGSITSGFTLLDPKSLPTVKA